MSRQGVSLGRGRVPSFGGISSGIPVMRVLNGIGYATATGFGLYGSTSYVRAAVLGCLPSSDATNSTLIETSTTGRGWTLNGVANTRGVRFRHFNGVGTIVSPTIVPLRAWPLLSVYVATWDGSTFRSYLNGVNVSTQGIATGITPADPSDVFRVWRVNPSFCVAHFLGSDSAGAFLDDAGVAAWAASVKDRILKNIPILPWTNCERWWNVGSITRDHVSWTDEIGGVVASTLSTVVVSNLPNSSIHF